MPDDFEYQQAFQEFKDAGFSDEDAAVGAQTRIAQQTAPQGFVSNEIYNKGGFIGDPNQSGSNRFDPNIPVSGITGWTPGVVTAGSYFNLPGPSSSDLEKTFRDAGASEEDIANTVTKPADVVQAGMDKLLAAHDVPKETIDRVKKSGDEALARYRQLVKAGAGYGPAASAALAPWLDQAGQATAEHHYADPKLRQKETAWERNTQLYQNQLDAIEQAGSDEEKKLLEEQANLTKGWLDKNSKFAPPKSSQTVTEHQFLVPSPLGGTNAPISMTNITRRVTQPLNLAGAGTIAPDVIVIMRNPSGQSVKVPQSQVARARQLGYR